MLSLTFAQVRGFVGIWGVIQVGRRRFINDVCLLTIRQIKLLQVNFSVVQNRAD